MQRSIAKNENYANALFKKFGWFNSAKLSIVTLSNEIVVSAPYYSKVKEGIENKSVIIADKIRYKNTEYSCGVDD